MSRTGILILIGILTILTPFSGFPIAMRSILTVAFGVAVLGIGLSLRARDVERHEMEATHVAPPAPPAMG